MAVIAVYTAQVVFLLQHGLKGRGSSTGGEARAPREALCARIAIVVDSAHVVAVKCALRLASHAVQKRHDAVSAAAAVAAAVRGAAGAARSRRAAPDRLVVVFRIGGAGRSMRVCVLRIRTEKMSCISMRTVCSARSIPVYMCCIISVAWCIVRSVGRSSVGCAMQRLVGQRTVCRVCDQLRHTLVHRAVAVAGVGGSGAGVDATGAARVLHLASAVGAYQSVGVFVVRVRRRGVQCVSGCVTWRGV